METCEVCGALVADPDVHAWWHREGHPIWPREKVERHRFDQIIRDASR